MDVLTILNKLGDTIPYAVLYLLIVLVMLGAEQKREKVRVDNATKLENKREAHEKAMQDKQLQHERDQNNLWALQIREMVDRIVTSNQAVLNKLDVMDEAADERYKRLGITQDLLKAAEGKTIQRRRE